MGLRFILLVVVLLSYAFGVGLSWSFVIARYFV